MTAIIKRGRKLKSEDEVFTQNAWDDTEWTDDMIREAEARLEEQKRISRNYKSDVDALECNVTIKWNQFYAMHEDKFFKDRKWIFSEFPELLARISNTDPQETCDIFEVGCGVGNAVVHILQHNRLPKLKIHCCDLSDNAIEILKKRDIFIEHQSQVNAFQADMCEDFVTKVRSQVREGSLDFIMLIFSLSALKPERMGPTIQNLTTLLKPGGMLLFRDYARYDLTQLRFKDYVMDLFIRDGNLTQAELKQDNRLLVNRLKGIKMCRCWIQGKFAKK